MLAKRLGGNREKEIENILHGPVTQLVTEASGEDICMVTKKRRFHLQSIACTADII